MTANILVRLGRCGVGRVYSPQNVRRGYEDISGIGASIPHCTVNCCEELFSNTINKQHVVSGKPVHLINTCQKQNTKLLLGVHPNIQIGRVCALKSVKKDGGRLSDAQNTSTRCGNFGIS